MRFEFIESVDKDNNECKFENAFGMHGAILKILNQRKGETK